MLTTNTLLWFILLWLSTSRFTHTLQGQINGTVPVIALTAPSNMEIPSNMDKCIPRSDKKRLYPPPPPPPKKKKKKMEFLIFTKKQHPTLLSLVLFVVYYQQYWFVPLIAGERAFHDYHGWEVRRSYMDFSLHIWIYKCRQVQIIYRNDISISVMIDIEWW